ncbi:unnamed protein product [Microthlaspi erraticum]|uniref:F-box domain-containing protein n=1 Tax=Microthlaspi erraticum TaxID=1685480 RepID=A0A6D2L746_9BRAS|nr:unnamed protein product [Microthlaspi erraticum]
MEDRISALPNDLLVKILLHVSTKHVASTMILSKRWRFVWAKLEYIEDTDDQRARDSACSFLDKALELHKESVLETLRIDIKGSLFIDVDVDFEKWIANAVDRHVRVLEFELLKSRKLTNLPNSLYTCKTLVELTLSHNVLVDVPSAPCLPSLKKMLLFLVVYKDEDSLLRLVSNCSVLAKSTISFFISDRWKENTSIKNIHLTKDQPCIHIFCRADNKILRSLSLATSLALCLKFPMVPISISTHLSLSFFVEDWSLTRYCDHINFNHRRLWILVGLPSLIFGCLRYMQRPMAGRVYFYLFSGTLLNYGFSISVL